MDEEFYERWKRGMAMASSWTFNNREMLLGIVRTLDDVRVSSDTSPADKVQASKALFDVLCGGNFPYEWFEGDSK